MFLKLPYIITLILFFFTTPKNNFVEESDHRNPLVFSRLSASEQGDALDAFLNDSCQYKGIKLFGKVKFVTSFPDIKIKYVESFADIDVQFVTSFPNSCGKWQEVNSFPDFTVQIVDAFPDLKVRRVESFPGMN